ncbi:MULTISPECIES: hypothetical protein [Methylomonas]|uniref:Uncharacterized protein n=2 Tax=Methylomonas TaxID=416 RepID=A0A140E5D6_9GAMM|nr:MULTISPECIES: hypothetical protein [Methylomonas]AMK75610.1 hypothetical protein JT25_003765 [Methylomonas denitrificans]OAI08873.1 hypothetical protein A1342_08500 [Methylomonas methanica]TCV73862.1 hypothetical protein EDE11_14314 [Methylomonas methanica]
MDAIMPYFGILLYILLATSAATLILFILAIVFQKHPLARRIDSLGKLIGAVTSLGGLMISLINISTPPVPDDEGASTIKAFYIAIQRRKFNEAYNLIHDACIDEIKKNNPIFDQKHFMADYATTAEYRNFKITRVNSLEDNKILNYALSFDVKDMLPRSRIYQLRNATLKDWVAAGIINKESLFSFILEDIKEYYDIPQDAEPIIREYLSKRRFETLLGPEVLPQLQRNIQSIELKKRVETPPLYPVWRHFLLHLQLLEDNGQWKIRQGIEDPTAIAEYLLSAPPSD